eukprot:TRINITY_DN5606_c0_g1_i1.p4 TRINITY_DN5606_c0_g1~~TRINITY_DN5606_c0_g1_i1.p4  ORF type:complete len:69 (-),score=6.97 TRINITY_DN5606_c0_g1_i1:201-407(-)
MFFITEVSTEKIHSDDMFDFVRSSNRSMRKYCQTTNLKAFGNVTASKTIRSGVQNALMSTGDWRTETK